MKKILALVLAAVMVLGMGMTGFAASWNTGETFTAEVTGNETEVTAAGTLTATIPISKLEAVTGDSPARVIGDEAVSFDTAKVLYTAAVGADNSVGINTRDIRSLITDNDISFTVSASQIRISVKLPVGRFEVGDLLDFEVGITGDGTINYTYMNATTTKNEDVGDIAVAGLVATFRAEVVSSTTTDDTTAPTVSSSTPTNGATSVSTSTSSYTVTFNEAIGTVGTVTIGGTTMTLASTSGNAYTYTMPGALSNNSTYAVVISGFADVDGNVMDTVTRTFSTGTTSSTTYNKATEGKVTAFDSNYSLLYGYSSTGTITGYSRETGRYGQVDLGDVYPADEQVEKIWLLSPMFTWNTAGDFYNNNAANYYLTSQIVRNSKVSARTQVAAGSKAINSTTIEYDGGCAYVEVEFVDEWVSVDELDFEFTTYILIDGKRADTAGEGLTFYGTLKNHKIYVYSNDDYVDTSLGEVAHAQDFVSSIEVDLGSGVSIFTKFFKDKKYYGTASRDADEAADVVFAKYPDVDNVVILKTVGLNSTGDIVKLDTDYSDYYVYDKDLNYLGQSNTRLPFSSRYYLANRKLDVDSDYEAEDPGEEPEWTDNAETGGDAGVSNANANPGTGR